MRITKLLLKAFGPFTEREVDLTSPPGTVNVVYGVNEAGKSSALRALEAFCFGIPDRTTDDHIHNYGSMQVGASLALDNGKTGTFIRRKKKKNSLSDLKGPIDDSEFEEFLCDVNKSGFEALFCLSYKRLTEGSESILEEGGELGRLLFEARSDLSLRVLQSTLSDRMAALYRGTARSPAAIDEALRTFDASRKIVRKGDIAEYKELRDKLADLEAAAAATKENLMSARTERRRLDRKLSAVSLVRRLTRAREAVSELGDVPDLGDSFDAEFVAAKSRKAVAESSFESASKQALSVSQRRSQISVNRTILQWRAEIERLNTQVEQITRHLADIPKEEKKATEALAEARSALRRVRPDEEPDEANLQLGQAQKTIGRLGRERASLDQKLANAKAEAASVRARIQDAKTRLEQTAAVQITSSLTNAVASARALGDAETRLQSQKRELQRLQVGCDQVKAQLGAAEKSLEDFVRSTLPTPSVVKEFEDRWRGIDAELKGANDALGKALAKARTVQTERDALVNAGSVPTEADLLKSRELRDNQWQDLKLQITSPHQEPIPSEGIEAFEASIVDADAISDRLRREADRSAKLGQFDAQIEAVTKEIESLQATIVEIEGKREAVQQAWTHRWLPANIVPDPPRQMIDWLAKFDQLQKTALEIEQVRSDVVELTQQISSSRTLLLTAMNLKDEEVSLARLLGIAEEQILSAEKTKGLIAELNQSLRTLGSALESAEANIDGLEKDLATWDSRWQIETACLRLAQIPTVDDAEDAVKAITTAAEKLSTARIAEKRVHGMQHDYRGFSEATAKVVKAIAPDLEALPPIAAIQNIYRALGESITLEAKHTELADQQTALEETLRISSEDLESANDKLLALCKRAGCADFIALEDIVSRYRQWCELRASISEYTSQLEEIAGGISLDEFCSSVEFIDPDTARPQLESLDVEIEALENELSRLNRDIGEYGANLTALDADKTQIENQLSAQAALARIRSSVRPYLVFMAAESLIRNHIEEFRRAHQGPILKKAAEIFSVLTDGSFTELSTGLDDKDQRVLLAIRTSRNSGIQEELKVDALSSATRMGLYLSLRLACLYHRLQQREGLPFVADDILLDFDDLRAHRVMEELGRLSEKTQVILFTHHKHLVEIGKEVLGERCLVGHLDRA